MLPPTRTILDVTINLAYGTRNKVMKQYYVMTSSSPTPESELMPEEAAQQFASVISDVLGATLIDGMLDNLPTYAQITGLTVKCPQQPAIYNITAIGAAGRGSSMAGENLGSRVFAKLSSNKGAYNVSRRIHHIGGIHEGGQADGKFTEPARLSIQNTWQALLTADLEVEGTWGGETALAYFVPAGIEHTKILKTKDDDTEYFAYVLPETYSGWSWYTVTSYVCGSEWKQFDK